MTTTPIPHYKDDEPLRFQPSRYRPNLDPPTDRIRKLPIYRGYPVPWFVAWIQVPDPSEPKGGIRIMVPGAVDREKFVAAIRQRLCWVCGESLGKFMTFVVGPMCGINRTSAEPPSHLDCARWSVRNCPFLSQPDFDRREKGMEGSMSAGHMIPRNPGVSLLWTCTKYTVFDDGAGKPLLRMGEPTSCEWRERRKATRAEVKHSIETGLPALEKADQDTDPEEARFVLRKMAVRFEQYLPKEEP